MFINKIIIIMLLALLSARVFAESVVQVNTAEKPAFPIVEWKSESPGDVVTVQNGTAAAISILIVVDKDPNYPAATGITIRNCGTTNHLYVGSSVVCRTNDPIHPVQFSTDNATPVKGTYQIQQP